MWCVDIANSNLTYCAYNAVAKTFSHLCTTVFTHWQSHFLRDVFITLHDRDFGGRSLSVNIFKMLCDTNSRHHYLALNEYQRQDLLNNLIAELAMDESSEDIKQDLEETHQKKRKRLSNNPET
jgi:hypothetical protein